jgi:hypothetical protein
VAALCGTACGAGLLRRTFTGEDAWCVVWGGRRALNARAPAWAVLAIVMAVMGSSAVSAGAAVGVLRAIFLHNYRHGMVFMLLYTRHGAITCRGGGWCLPCSGLLMIAHCPPLERARDGKGKEGRLPKCPVSLTLVSQSVSLSVSGSHYSLTVSLTLVSHWSHTSLTLVSHWSHTGLTLLSHYSHTSLTLVSL